MTDERDILDRLRDSGGVGLDLSPGCAVCEAAAAEIRRLRGERVGYEEALRGAAGANDELRREVEAARREAERHRREIERMAEERHLLHSSFGKGDRFWGCSRGPCKAASQYLRGNGDGGAAC